MGILSGVADFFGLDVGTTALRVVQLKGASPIKTLDRYGQLAVDGTMAISDSSADRQKVGKAVEQLLHEAGISSNNVAVNIPSQRVFTTIVDMDRMEPGELAKAIRYQADSFIPTPLADSKLDWAILGDSPKDPQKAEVLLSSVSNDFAEARLNMLESIGLNVVAIEPDNMALVRSMLPPDSTGAQMVLDIGHSAADLVVAMNGAPRLARSIPAGSQAIIRAAAQSLNIDQKQAEQFVFKFGLGKDKLEGKVYNAVIGTVDGLMNEIEKSIKFFQERYTLVKIDKIIVTGGASTLPEFPLYIANRFGISVEIGNAWRNVNVPSSQQNELMAVSNHFAVAAGLAERDT
ncbi:MAG TPA: type IV pilus assembly protein PilM [Candidatus Saccharimonadales bacterium]|nr:type IV pilus assembly protein PilM [Candidatus Saccharimonadales bacterium]